jgi:DNA-binding beta-propeller fold protein YncE
VYIADEYNSRIRKVTVSTGIITTIAGSGSTTGDGGPATAGRLYNPTGLVLDSAGNIYIADWYDNRVRKVTISTGIITTLAGNGGTGSYSGDFGAATAAELYTPYGVALDSSGNYSCYLCLFLLIILCVSRQRVYRRI